MKGVPPGSILGPILFSVHTNNVGQNGTDARMHLYADDMEVYCQAKSVISVPKCLQSAFDSIQSDILQLKLVLNADKTKATLFENQKRCHK